MFRKIAGFALLLCMGLTDRAALAQGVSNPPVPPAPRLYDTNTKTDVLAFAAGGAMLGFARLIKPRTCPEPCAGGPMNGLDRPFAGHNERGGADRASTVLLGTALAAPFLVNISTSRNDVRPKQYGRDAVALGETLMITEGLTNIVKNAVGRPRPFVRGLTAADARYGMPDSYKSFYSGHSATAFAMAMSFARMYTRSHPGGKPGLVYGMGIGLAAVTGTLRVDAGKHYPTDVITGALAGSAIGLFVIPALHR